MIIGYVQTVWNIRIRMIRQDMFIYYQRKIKNMAVQIIRRLLYIILSLVDQTASQSHNLSEAINHFMKRLLIKFNFTRSLQFKFSKEFIKDTVTEFQKEIGLTDKLKKMVQASSTNQKSSQAMLSVPFIMGVSCFVLVILSFNTKTRKSILYSSQLLLALFSANVCSAKICQDWVLNSIHKYTSNVKTLNSPTFLFQMQHYLRRNGVQTSVKAEKINKILLYGCEVVGNNPLPKYQESMHRLLEFGYHYPELKSSDGLKKIGQLLLNTGDIESQYLSLLIFPDLSISKTVVQNFNSNLNKFERTKDIAVPSFQYKCSLTKKYIIYILSHMKKRGQFSIQIPTQIKQIYTRQISMLNNQ